MDNLDAWVIAMTDAAYERGARDATQGQIIFNTETWAEARSIIINETLDKAVKAIMRRDDMWSITTQHAPTRDFLQWCFREARDAVNSLRPEDREETS
jgi:hypothetical protein